MAKLALALAVAGAALPSDLFRAPDFPPFEMTIREWNARRSCSSAGCEPGTFVYRLVYESETEWDEEITDASPRENAGSRISCHDGVRTYFDADKRHTSTSTDPTLCRSGDRWIHRGLATGYHWRRTDGPAPGQLTYEDSGERVVFDLATRLPVRYEAWPAGGVPELTVDYVLVRYGR